MEDKNYCVYVHRRKDTDEIIYVGEGRFGRAKFIKVDTAKNKKHQKIAQEVGVYFEIVQDGLTKEEVITLEEKLIVEYRKQGFSITNVNTKSTTALPYRREDYADKVYVDPTSPSGLRWLEDRKNFRTGRILARKDAVAGCKNKLTGYWSCLNKAAHRIVYALVHGECPAGLTVDHIDCDKDNNSPENLRLLTCNENSSRGNVFKVYPTGENVSTAKLSKTQILQMYKMFENGANNAEIGKFFNLHERYVSLIRHGKRWKSVYDEYGKIFPDSFTEPATTTEQLQEALYLIELGLTNKDIALATDIEASTVSRIRHGKLFAKQINNLKGTK